MSGAEIVSLNESRRRRNPFAGTGRHRRTPEAWAQMQIELQAAQARCAQMQRERDHARGEVEELKYVVDSMREEMRTLGGEVKRMAALMGADPDHPANQNTITIVPPAAEDPEETQPIAAGELFADGDPMAPLRPKIRVGTIGCPDPAAPPVTLVVPSEMVKHVSVTQPIPLWNTPFAQGYRAQRHTA